MNLKTENKISEILDWIIKPTGTAKNRLFLSERFHAFPGISRNDDTIFFPLLSTYTLLQLKNDLPEKFHVITDQLISFCIDLLEDYKNRNERDTYNFWKKEKNAHFPNGYIFHHLKKYAICDDADVTAFAYLVRKEFDYDQAKKILITHHTPALDKDCYPKLFSELAVYSTWYGEKMRRQVDVSVLSNILLWALRKEGELNELDHNAIEYIERAVIDFTYIKSLYRAAHTYFIPEIIHYHLSRLVSVHRNFFTPSTINLLAEQGKILFDKSNSSWKKLILSTSLMRLKKIKTGEISFKQYNWDYKNFEWFSAAFLSHHDNSFLQLLNQSRWLEFRFKNKAYYLILYLENLVLQEI